MLWTVMLVAVAAAALTAARPVKAEPIPYPKTPFAYVVIRQDVAGFFREFAAWAGVYLDIDRRAQGVIDGPLPPLEPDALLDRIAAEHGLFWWYDGAVLHVGPVGEISTASLPLAPERAEDALAALERSGLLEPRYPVRLDTAVGLATATGPKAYVEKVVATLESAARAAEPGADRSDWRPVQIVRNGRVQNVLAPRGATLGSAQ